MVVVNKPAGVVVHPAPGNERGTLVNGLLARFPELRDDSGELRPGIVHRLDKDTSGLMVVGRTLEAVADLQRQLASRSTTEKRYLLLVIGNIHEFKLVGVRSAEGKPLVHDAAWYTLWNIPKD